MVAEEFTSPWKATKIKIMEDNYGMTILNKHSNTAPLLMYEATALQLKDLAERISLEFKQDASEAP